MEMASCCIHVPESVRSFCSCMHIWIKHWHYAFTQDHFLSQNPCPILYYSGVFKFVRSSLLIIFLYRYRHLLYISKSCLSYLFAGSLGNCRLHWVDIYWSSEHTIGIICHHIALFISDLHFSYSANQTKQLMQETYLVFSHYYRKCALLITILTEGIP